MDSRFDASCWHTSTPTAACRRQLYAKIRSNRQSPRRSRINGQRAGLHIASTSEAVRDSRAGRMGKAGNLNSVHSQRRPSRRVRTEIHRRNALVLRPRGTHRTGHAHGAGEHARDRASSDAERRPAQGRQQAHVSRDARVLTRDLPQLHVSSRGSCFTHRKPAVTGPLTASKLFGHRPHNGGVGADDFVAVWMILDHDSCQSRLVVPQNKCTATAYAVELSLSRKFLSIPVRVVAS